MNKLNFSYASEVEHNIAQRLIIKLIENLTGKRKLENFTRNICQIEIIPQIFGLIF